METINLPKGTTTEIRMKSMATSGYSWQYSMDNEGIISVEQTGQTPADEKPKPGQSLDEIFMIRGLSPGAVTLHFQQQRSWEKEAAPATAIDYQINVT